MTSEQSEPVNYDEAFVALAEDLRNPTETELQHKLKESLENFINAIGVILDSQSPTTLVENLEADLPRIADKHVYYIAQAYDLFVSTSPDDYSLVLDKILSLLVHAEDSIINEASMTDKECLNCQTFRPKVIELGRSIRAIVDNVNEVSEDDMNMTTDKLNGLRRVALMNFIVANLNADLSHVISDHRPERYEEIEDKKGNMAKVGKHILDIAKLGIGVGLGVATGIILARSNKRK